MRGLIDIQGLTVEVTRAGQGPPLLYLHAGDELVPDAPFLAEIAKEFEVIAPSHPGFGNSALPDHFDSVDDLSYFYLDLLDHLNLGPAIVVGSSLGGWIAAEIATKSQRHISHLALFAPLGVKFAGRDVIEIKDIFFRSHRELRQLLRADGKPDDRDYASLADDALARMVRNYETFTLLGWAPLLHNPKLKQRLHRIKVPSLIVRGDCDQIVDQEYFDSFGAAINARVETVIDAGHYVHDDKPHELAKMITNFFHGELEP